jgi:hypothetical protein
MSTAGNPWEDATSDRRKCIIQETMILNPLLLVAVSTAQSSTISMLLIFVKTFLNKKEKNCQPHVKKSKVYPT